MYPGTPIENKLGCNWGCIEINWGFGGLHCVVPCGVGTAENGGQIAHHSVSKGTIIDKWEETCR